MTNFNKKATIIYLRRDLAIFTIFNTYFDFFSSFNKHTITMQLQN